jgi:PhnB protein
MPNQLNPYLHFNGNARDAMTFHQSVFGGDLDVMTFGDQGMDGPDADKVMHSYLGAGVVQLMGSDAPPGETLQAGDTVRLSLSGDGDDELRAWFAALSEGGEVHVPLEKQVWGDEFGQVADRFGVVWLVNIAQGDSAG